MRSATLEQLLTRARGTLEEAGVEQAALEVRLLAQETLRLSHAELITEGRQGVPEPLVAELEALVQRRARREPLAYVLGHTEFYGRRFLCDRRALIPRPETELLVEAAHEATGALRPEELVAEIGTGTGAVAVTLALLDPQAEVWATDLSPAALQVARLNVHRYHLAGRVRLLPGSLLTPLREASLAERIGLLVSNPPYVCARELDRLAPEIRDWEPRVALDGGRDGLAVYRELLAQAAQLPRLRAVVLEIGYDQGPALRDLLAEYLPAAEVEIRPDLAGHDRVVLARLSDTAAMPVSRATARGEVRAELVGEVS